MNFSIISTELLVLVLALVLMAVDLILPAKETRRSIGYIAIFGLLGLFLHTFTQYHLGHSEYFYQNLFILDNFAIFFKQLFILSVGFTILFSLDYVETLPKYRGEYYVILLFALLGMMVMASANDFLTMFVGLELMTISFYILVGYKLGNRLSSEAGVKYLLIGSASTAVMLYGISLVYGVTSQITFAGICMNYHLFYAAGLAGITMVMIGFFFKLSVIPFHMWAPDIYQGAPTPITALLAMGSKAAGLAVFMRILYTAFPITADYWLPILSIFAAICMIFGNIMAIRQENLKRMLAYSSIAQAGYMMVGIVAADVAGMKAVMFYALLYVFANVGAFAVLAVIDKYKGGTDTKDIKGLSRTAPILAAVMTISLLSMAGIPPAAGFVGKLYLFTAVVEQGYLWLAFVGFIMSMISVYYYLMVAKAMYMEYDEDETKIVISGAIRAVVLISSIATILIGICPEKVALITNIASQTFMR